MNTDEARFVLSAFRPDGRDAADPAFAEALAATERDPALRRWLERERATDAAVIARLQEVAPPPDLKSAILAGARASRPRRFWWPSPAWLAVAAGVAGLLLAVAPWGGKGTGWSAEDFATQARHELLHDHASHVGRPPELAAVQDGLAQVPGPWRTNLRLNPGELDRKRCRAVRLGGHEVFEICFEREGAWYHLYVMRAATLAPNDRDALHFETTAGVTSAVWCNAGTAYALVTQVAPEVVRQWL
jgi:hypothetical protein